MARPDDIVLVAYPKSGSNLVLFRLARLLYGISMDWATKGDWVQAIGSAEPPAPPTPRLIWSHEMFDPSYPKVVYLVRDPRDVAVSYHHHHLKYYGPSGWNETFDVFFDRFVRGDVWPGSWSAHVDAWTMNGSAIAEGLHVVRYEDLLQHATEQTRRLGRFVRGDVSSDAVGDAIAWSSFENMRRLEDLQWSHLDQAISTKATPSDRIAFVRVGRAGGWVDSLSTAQRELALSAWGASMTRLGYEP